MGLVKESAIEKNVRRLEVLHLLHRFSIVPVSIFPLGQYSLDRADWSSDDATYRKSGEEKSHFGAWLQSGHSFKS